jgi:hypothetical protein
MLYKLTSSFVAVEKNNNENKHLIKVLTDFIEIETRGGKETIEGMKKFITNNNKSVNRIDKGEYQIINGLNPTDLISTDPNCV